MVRLFNLLELNPFLDPSCIHWNASPVWLIREGKLVREAAQPIVPCLKFRSLHTMKFLTRNLKLMIEM